MTLFVFQNGRTYPRLEHWLRRPASSSIGRWLFRVSDHFEHRRNPRDLEYMARLAQQVNPSFDRARLLVLQDARRLPPQPWEAIDEIVLLWPDGNGTGWSEIERDVLRRKAPTARVSVLNGRRRSFPLSRAEWRRARLRRALEKSLVVELGVLVLFLLTSPVLALWDVLHGKRVIQ